MGCTPRFRLTGIVALGLQVGAMLGCAPPSVVYRPAADVVADEKGGPLAVALTTGELFVVASGRVSNDTLYAIRKGAGAAQDAAIAVPVNRISSLTRTDAGLTAAGAGAAGLLAGVLIGVTVIVVLLLGIPST